MEDQDNDGLSALNEFNLGTDLNIADSDGDGLSDGDEVNTFGTIATQSDSDNDGTVGLVSAVANGNVLITARKDGIEAIFGYGCNCRIGTIVVDSRCSCADIFGFAVRVGGGYL